MSYTLKLPWESYQRLQVYADNVKTEIGGLGRIALDSAKGEFTLTEVFLLEQEASGGECELSSEGINTLYQELIEADKDIDNIRCWWHSHGTMGVFFSKTDTDTLDEWPADWVVAVVINQKKELKARIQVLKPISMYMDLDVEIIYPQVVEVQELIDEIELKVTSPPCKVVAAQQCTHGHGNYYGTYVNPNTGNKTPWKDPKHNNKQGVNRWGWEDEDDDKPTPLHAMSQKEYEDTMMEEYSISSEEDEATKYDRWMDKYIEAAEADDTDEQLLLLEKAVEDDIIEADEVAQYLCATVVSVEA